MPGLPPETRRGEDMAATEGRDAAPAEDMSCDAGELNEEDGSWSPGGDLQGCGQLERRWILWHQFMKEHAHLDAWLRLAEQAVGSANPAHVTYVTAKEDVRKFERLRREAGPRLVQLDSLTRRNRALTRLFQGAMQARLLAAARESGQRWDDVNAKLETITGHLKLFLSEWEGFETEREELALWLADLDVRLTQVDHLTGNTCEKLRRLQSFQQCVCVNSCRVNGLLRRGEALIQRSQPADVQHVESRLQELLHRCSLVYSNITRTHTRLLSMRLVFEDDWILSQATDSGCPSESLLEEEGALDKANLDLPAGCSLPKDFNPPSLLDLPPPPPSPSSPAHEHLGLEWDPSVDIGRSVSRDNAGLCHKGGVKRRSYLSSLGSQSDISDDNQEVESPLEGWLDHAHPSAFSPVAPPGGVTRLSGDQWATSTPDGADGEPAAFDEGRVRAWLGVQSPAPPERTTSCSQVKCYLDGSQRHRRDNTPPALPDPPPRQPSDPQADAEQQRCEEAECLLSEQSGGTSSRSRAPSSSLSPGFLYLLLAAALALLACLMWVLLEPPCHRGSRMHRSLHLLLRYNGPPPT